MKLTKEYRLNRIGMKLVGNEGELELAKLGCKYVRSVAVLTKERNALLTEKCKVMYGDRFQPNAVISDDPFSPPMRLLKKRK